MSEKSNLTSQQILEDSIRYSIPIYLQEGETEEGMIKKFKGDLVKTIQFLRTRSFDSIEVVKKSKPIPKPKEVPAKKQKKVSKPNTGKSNTLF